MHEFVCFERTSCASLAQLVEHALRKRIVRGSIPLGGLDILSVRVPNIHKAVHALLVWAFK